VLSSNLYKGFLSPSFAMVGFGRNPLELNEISIGCVWRINKNLVGEEIFYNFIAIFLVELSLTYAHGV
jgi:hypothetical protein